MNDQKNNSDNAEFLVGTIVGFHGLQGEVKVRPACNNPELLLDINHIQIKKSSLGSLMLEIDSLRFDKQLLIMSFIDYEDRNSVEPLYKAELFTFNSEIGELEEEEFWVKDLVGMNVFAKDGSAVGTIVDIMYGGNDLLEIRRDSDPPGKTILIPFVREIVPVLDFKNKRIELADIPGLLEAQ